MLKEVKECPYRDRPGAPSGFLNSFDPGTPNGPLPIHVDVLPYLDILSILQLSSVNKELHFLCHRIFEEEEKYVPKNDPSTRVSDLITPKHGRLFRLKTLLTNSTNHEPSLLLVSLLLGQKDEYVKSGFEEKHYWLHTRGACCPRTTPSASYHDPCSILNSSTLFFLLVYCVRPNMFTMQY